MQQLLGTTILCVRRGNVVAMAGDGQVTLGNVVFKGTARKVRRVYHDKVIVGFAGATADAFTLVERFEGVLEKHSGNLIRSAFGSPDRCTVCENGSDEIYRSGLRRSQCRIDYSRFDGGRHEAYA